jgi:ribosome biogenesis protein ERB1
MRKAMKEGRMKTLEQEKEDRENEEKEDNKCWDIWEDDSIVAWKPRKMPKAIVAPKRDMPLHSESFNPPEEYLLDNDEKEKWQKAEKEDREFNYIPSKVDALRKVPFY